jgi:uncharacterized membrane-anchored protein YitT (DUF2179 family)
MPMESKKIKELIDRYLAAETTLSEEQQLRTYFRSGKVDASLNWAKMLFAYSETTCEKQLNHSSVPSSSFDWRRIAAAVAIICVTSFGVYRLQENHQQKKMQLAYQQTKEAFDLIATQMNKGTTTVSYLGYYEKSVSSLINK